MSVQSVWNYEAMTSCYGDDDDFIAQSIEIYLAESEKLLVDLALAIESSSVLLVRATIHALKGQAATFFLLGVEKAALTLEASVDQTVDENVHFCYESLKSAYQTACAELNDFISHHNVTAGS